MYLKKSRNKDTGRLYLSMAKSFREKGKKYPKTKTIEKFGYLDEFEGIYDDPIAHFEKIVEGRNLAETQAGAEYIITAQKGQTLEKNTANRKNYGYIIILKLFYGLGLDRFLVNRQARSTKIECSTSAVMKMLVISRILCPGSKKKDYEGMGRYFDFEGGGGFRQLDIYRSLSHFAGLAKDIQILMHNRITEKYGRSLDLIYYDVTNYYFEIDDEDELRKKGPSKENRKSPIVQMGLAMDAGGLPISYDLFAGNESEKLHLRPMILELRDKYGSGSVIAVADSAHNTGNNIYYLDQGRQGYIFSQSIRGGSAGFKEYVLAGGGYEWHGEEYKRKSRAERRELQVDFIRKDGTTHKKKVSVDQRQIVFYSEKYAARARGKRESALKKAQKIIENPSAYTQATSYGALKYVMNVDVDEKTGEIKPTKSVPRLDLDKVKEDEKFDGYYAIVTNVFDEGENKGKYGDDKIIGIYRGLWQIEDTFKISKSGLRARPVYLSREDRIKAHFLICFITLVIIRLIEKHTGYKHSPEKLIQAMNDISCTHEGENLYIFDHRDDVTDDLGDAFGIDFTKLRLTRKEIKKNLGEAKKQ